MKTSDTLSNSSFTLYCLSSLRILAIATAIMFLPACAIPLGINGAMAGIICSLVLSILWNLFTLVYESWSATALPCTMMLLVDIMVCPSILIVFAVICITGEIGNGKALYDAHKREILAFGLLLAVGIMHALCFLLWTLIVYKYESQSKSRLTTPSRLSMRQWSNHRHACRKQRPLPPIPERESNVSICQAVDVLPLYTPGEIGRPPPAYKSIDETHSEYV